MSSTTPLPAVTVAYVDRDYVSRLDETEKALVIWIIGPIIVFGVAGNILSIMTLRARPFRAFQSTFLLIVLAFCDIGVLVTNALYDWILRVSEFDLAMMGTASCKLVYYLGPLIVYISGWTLVLITLERMVSVLRPNMAHLFSSDRIWISWVVMVGILALFDFNVLLFFGIHEFPKYNPETNTSSFEKHCDFSPKHIDKMSKYSFWADLFIGSVIPSVLIFTFNVAIIRRLAGSYHQVGGLAVIPQPTRKHSSITVMLVVVSIVFLFCTLPVRVYQVGYKSWWANLDTDPVQFAKERLTYTAFTIPYYINNAINFILYVIVNPTFRQAFLRRLCCKSVDGGHGGGVADIGDMTQPIAPDDTRGPVGYGMVDAQNEGIVRNEHEDDF